MSSKKKKAESLEESLGRLEVIVSELESGQYSLEESLQRFEEGLTLGKRCREILDSAEMRVKQLVDVTDDGAVETEDMPDAG